MVREFSYRGEKFRATVHGKPGKEEIFLIHMLEDDEEGPEISLDRFEDADNDPTESLDTSLAALANKLIHEQNLQCSDPEQGFAWIEAPTGVNVHNGIQDHHAAV
ncbi:MAG: hypothetical protein WC782_00705 [Methylococcaceae bacterium]|jgi:hypothetical protein